jgi:hypothetical protein
MANDPQRPSKPVKLVVAQPLDPPSSKGQKQQPRNTPSPGGSGAVARGSKSPPPQPDADNGPVEPTEPASTIILSGEETIILSREELHKHSRRRGSRWTIPLALAGLAIAGGFIWFVAYTVSKHAPSIDLTGRTRQDDLIFKRAAHPPISPPANSIVSPSDKKLPGTQSTPANAKSAAQPQGKSPGPADNSLARLLSNGQLKNVNPDGSPVVAASASQPNGGNPVASTAGKAATTAPKTASHAAPAPPVLQPLTVPPPSDYGSDQLLDLYRSHKLFAKASYPAIRQIFAKRFEERFREYIKRAFGSETASMNAWLDKNPDIKEDFYTAIDEEHNDVLGALSLMKQLKDRFPDKIAVYPNLAIAVAVTWDKSGKGIYDYLANVQSTKSKLPGDRLDGPGNFDYFIQGERAFGPLLKPLPWEFLVHLVNHHTPFVERRWAADNYFSDRTMFGRCYRDVPYDHTFEHSKTKKSKLAGQEYTLENIRRFGGVAAEQADFASRVGKSLCVPAECVRDTPNDDLHAWVVWVEVKNATKNGVAFAMESEGRVFGGHFYVGVLDDPQTAMQITDRDLERRLQAVAVDPIAHRQAALIMRAYPAMRDSEKMSLGEQMRFLDQVMKLSPLLDEPWLELARMSKEGQFNKDHAQIQLIVDHMFTIFAAAPDLTWKIFDDLTAFQTSPKQRVRLFDRLIAMYEQVNRPDLTADARLKYVDFLLAQKHEREAIVGLAATIKRFPDEYRSVPKLLDRLEALVNQSKLPHIDEDLIRFWQEYLVLIPKKHGDKPNPFCIAMYRRGIALFKSTGHNELADKYTAALVKIKAGTD